MRVIRARAEDLTPERDRALLENLYGDGTCDVKNVSSSCFASEVCARGRTPSRPPSMRDFLDSRHLYVAVEDSADGDDDDVWMGCALAERNMSEQSTLQILFPDHFQRHSCAPSRSTTVVSSLCVPPHCKQKGVGTGILDRVCEDFDVVYLMVDAHASSSCSFLRDFMERRSTDLCSYYAKRGFEACGRRDGFILHVRARQ